MNNPAAGTCQKCVSMSSVFNEMATQMNRSFNEKCVLYEKIIAEQNNTIMQLQMILARQNAEIQRQKKDNTDANVIVDCMAQMRIE